MINYISLADYIQHAMDIITAYSERSITIEVERNQKLLQEQTYYTMRIIEQVDSQIASNISTIGHQ